MAGVAGATARWRRSAIVAIAVACAGLVGCMYYLNPLCTDGIRNGNESDVDCGGPACKPCAIGRACRGGEDCENGFCAGGMCRPLPCFNGAQDEAETDVDCGGGTCRKCAGGRHCAVDADCFGGKCDAATSTCSSLANVSFTDAVSYFSGSKAYAMFSSDLNHDGYVDLVVANELDSTITVFLGVGDGTFRRLEGLTVLGDNIYPTGGGIADFNRDGIPDVVTADYHGNSVSVLFGVGDGRLQPASHYPTQRGAETSNLAIGDLNGDGYVDVIATNPATGSVSVFLGRADGTLGPATNLTIGIERASAPFSAAIGDFDGDGKNDVAVADMITRSIIVMLGNGDGTFGPQTAYGEGGTPAYICLARDMNVDAKLDIVCANRESDDVTVLLGRGDGTFQDAILSSTGPVTGPYAIAVADINRDGVPDVVTPNFKSGTASILLGRGDGSFEAPIDAGPTGVFSYGVVTADFDADGRPDIAVCNAVTNDVAVKLNRSF